MQSLVNSALMETERHLFGQNSLHDTLGASEALEVTRLLEEIEQKLMPMLERCQRMMNRALDRLHDRGRANHRPNLSIGIAGQVNVTGGEQP